MYALKKSSEKAMKLEKPGKTLLNFAKQAQNVLGALNAQWFAQILQ